MQTRLLASLAGGLLGLAVTSTINGSLGLPPSIAFTGCGLTGMAVGYVGSIFFDVFAGKTDEP
jgi:hypothetical protein